METKENGVSYERQEIIEKIKNVLSERGLYDESVSIDEEIYMDSLDEVELIMDFEEEFGFYDSETDFPYENISINLIADYVESKL